MAKDFTTHANFPLGLRNNNPGNLRYSESINWKGQIGQNKGFAVFRNIAFGIRAWGMDVTHDIKAGQDTIEKLISAYAPPSENNTAAYIQNVVRISGIPAKQKLTPNTDTLTRLGRGMFSVELGQQFSGNITDSDIREGLSMIGKSGNDPLPISVVPILLLIVLLIVFYNK